jgi:LytR cell envelope-related transcriptional attenuator
MSNEQPSRPRKSGSSASPMGSTLAIVIAIAAVVVGFLILRNIRSDDGPKTSATTLPPTTTIDPNLPPTSILPIATQPQVTVFTPTTTGASVIVANSSHQNGVAKTLSTALQGNQFTMVAPTNGATKEAVTKIQYVDGDAAAQAVAQSVATLMGVAAIEAMPTPVALADPATLGGATVVVLLGDDKAGKTLAQMTGADTTATTTAGGTTTTAAP